MAWLALLGLVVWHWPSDRQKPMGSSDQTATSNRDALVKSNPKTTPTPSTHPSSQPSTVKSDPQPAPKSATLAGPATAIDGDTIEIGGTHVRLNGIDAPEYAQQCEDAKHFNYSCGWQITSSLQKFLAKSKPTKCEFVTWDQYGRFVANCTRADGTDVADWLVRNGLALDWPKYSYGAYARQQAAAKAAKLGLWKGVFEEPWTWRAKQAERSAAKQRFTILNTQAQSSFGYSCQPRRTCSQISSCDEANWYLANCSWGGKLDRDKDGIPCESQC